MGYPSDPRHFSAMTPLQGEMRRRLWSTVLLGDMLISSQMGMLCMIARDHYDTAEPRNLNDADLDVDGGTSELPRPRPDAELISTLTLLVQMRLLDALGSIAALMASVGPHSYPEVMRVDALLNDAAARITPPLCMRSKAASVMETPQLIAARLFLAHVLYKGQIMLHRRYISPSTCPEEEEGNQPQ